MEQAIICKGVKKQVGNFALDYQEFSVAQGTVHGLIGANGSGKTTTLKLLLGLLRQDAMLAMLRFLVVRILDWMTRQGTP
nr:ATP-binding cassette domain-containing protein [uncultured Sphaerochaeta sp.]